jgi:hypothetical protein
VVHLDVGKIIIIIIIIKFIECRDKNLVFFPFVRLQILLENMFPLLVSLITYTPCHQNVNLLSNQEVINTILLLLLLLLALCIVLHLAIYIV